MKKLIYEDINLKTHFLYEIYSYNTGLRISDLKYYVYEVDPDGQRTFIGEFTEDEAYKFVREKCRQNCLRLIQRQGARIWK